MPRIALIGDFQPGVTAHQAIPKALALSAAACDCEEEPVWLATETIEAADLRSFAAFWSVPATPYRSMEGALHAIRFARESGRPLLGTCRGFQHAVIEYARDVIGISGAGHEETEIRERCHCRFGLNPAYRARLEDGGVRVSALASGEVRAIELPQHPFLAATLFQPERSSLAGAVHPLISAFIKAAQNHTGTNPATRGQVACATEAQ